MIKRILSALLLVMSCNAHADRLFSSVEEYAVWKTGLKLPEICLDYTRKHLQNKALPVAGIAFACDPDNRSAVVFVLGPEAGGGFRESDASNAFDITDPSAHTNFESIDLQTAGRFSLQHNALAGCGIEVTVFRFAKDATDWVVSGFDRDRPDCVEDRKPELGVSIADKLSVNFLTGRIEQRIYRNDKLVRKEVWHKHFSPFPLRDFTHYDERLYLR